MVSMTESIWPSLLSTEFVDCSVIPRASQQEDSRKDVTSWEFMQSSRAVNFDLVGQQAR